MAIFTHKSKVLEERAIIGTDMGNGDIAWDEVDFEYAWGLFRGNVLEDRGQKTVNGITYRLFYLPNPTPFNG